jgi:guanylate kinase
LGSSSANALLPVFVVTGPSGAGKGTLERELVRRRPGKLELAVSATTRRRRPDEQDGVHYWFKSDEEFDRLVSDGELLEWVVFAGNRYGTLRSEIDRIRGEGRAPLLDLEIEGAAHVEATVPGVVSVFVDAPLAELERRLRERATESSGEIGDRIEIARQQKAQAGAFDHVIENDDLARAVDELVAIVDRELAAAGTMSA